MTKPDNGETPSTGTAWTEAQARCGAAKLLATLAIPATDLTLLRFGNNAVFRVNAQYLLRVARPETPLGHLKQEVYIAATLAEHGAPVVWLTPLPVDQPVVAGDARGTLWEYLPGSGQVTYGQLGSLLRVFHDQTDALTISLPDWQPLASARRRLDALTGQYPDEDIALLEEWYGCIENALPALKPALPIGVIHGQAEIGNVLLRNGQPVFVDLERVARGWREWDLTDTAVTTLRFNMPHERYRRFADAYGFDVMTWDGFPVLRRVWELRATTWLMQARDHRPEIADQVQVRLSTWRNDDPDRVWQGF
jgi:Ser/Thr protein kinase RdoA (MazF antagonist)